MGITAGCDIAEDTAKQSEAQAGAQEEARAAKQASASAQAAAVRWTPEPGGGNHAARTESAGGGSGQVPGKTGVLVERIKRLILEDACAIDHMLIVTFTTRQASEMKEKIEKAIRREIDRVAEAIADADAEGSVAVRSHAEAKAEAEAGVDGAACGQDGDHADKQSNARRESSDASRAALQRDLVFLKRQLDSFAKREYQHLSRICARSDPPLFLPHRRGAEF